MSAAATTHTHPAMGTSLRQHLRRAAGRDHNPLCRALDRAYSRLVAGFALTLLGVLVVATAAAVLVVRAETRTAQQVARHRHVVTAVTTGPAVTDDLRAGSPRTHAQARWTYPAGPGTGSVPVPDGTLAGTAVRVGLDDAGHPVGAPKGAAPILSDATLVGLGTAAALGLGAEGGFALRRRALERRAEASWDDAWERVEPRWTGRR
ncbi:Rv1733c family protein [Kitasatospora sp. NPDC001660]